MFINNTTRSDLKVIVNGLIASCNDAVAALKADGENDTCYTMQVAELQVAAKYLEQGNTLPPYYITVVANSLECENDESIFWPFINSLLERTHNQ